MNNKLTFIGKISALVVFILPFVSTQQLTFVSDTPKYFFIGLYASFLIVYFAYLIFIRKINLSIKNRWLLLFLSLSLGVLWTASFLGIYPERSLYSDMLRMTGVIFISYVVFSSFIISELFTRLDWQILRRSIIFSSGLFSFLTFLGPEGFGFTGSFLNINFETTGLTLGNATFAGTFLALGFIVTLIEYSRSITKNEKLLFGSILALQFLSPLLLSKKIWTGNVSFFNPVSFLGDARASSAVVILVVIYVLGMLLVRYFNKKAIPVFLYSISWFIGLSVIVGFLFTPGSFIQDSYIKESTAARVIVWNSAFESFKDRPFLGWGPENFRLAIQSHFDNRLYLQENIGEIWFDRAHNIFLDNLISVGIVGLFFFILTFIFVLYTIYKSYINGHLNFWEAHLIGVLFFAHLLQLQTSFNTTTSYFIIGIFIGYVLWLEKNNIKNDEIFVGKIFSNIIASFLLLFVFFGVASPLYAEFYRQKSIVNIFTNHNQEDQLKNIKNSLSRTSDFEALRLTSSSFISGLLQQISLAGHGNRQIIIKNGLEQLSIFEKSYQRYLEVQPNDYRIRMNYSYLLLVKTILGEDSTNQARSILESSYHLSPKNPLTYILHSVVELYSGNLNEAQTIIQKGIELNPKIEVTRNIAEYIRIQTKNFPSITVIKLGNL